MRTYTAHLKQAAPPRLVREGWSWAGFLFGPVWLLAHRAWIPALLEVAAGVLLQRFMPAALHLPVLFGLALLNGLLGRDAVRWSLERRGYALAHVLLARDADDALLRLFSARPELAAQQR